MRARSAESVFAVLLLRQMERAGNAFGIADGRAVRGIDGRQPLGEQGYGAAFDGELGAVFFETAADEREERIGASGVEERQPVIAAAELRNEAEIPDDGIGRFFRKRAQRNAEDAALSDAAADIARVEEQLHRQIRLLGIGAQKPQSDLLLGSIAQGADGGEQIEAFGPGRAERCGTVLGACPAGFFFEFLEHGLSPLRDWVQRIPSVFPSTARCAAGQTRRGRNAGIEPAVRHAAGS